MENTAEEPFRFLSFFFFLIKCYCELAALTPEPAFTASLVANLKAGKKSLSFEKRCGGLLLSQWRKQRESVRGNSTKTRISSAK